MSASRLASSFGDLELVWRQLGFVYEAQKRYAESIEAYEKAGDRAEAARVTQSKKAEESRAARVELEARRKDLEEKLEAIKKGVDP